MIAGACIRGWLVGWLRIQALSACCGDVWGAERRRGIDIWAGMGYFNRAGCDGQRYRSGHNGADSKSCRSGGRPTAGTVGITGLSGISTFFCGSISTDFLRFFYVFSTLFYALPLAAVRRQSVGNQSCSGIEVVITALTRNQVYQQWYRGFESHPLRQVHVVKMLYRPQSQCFQHIHGPRYTKPEGRVILLFVSVK